MVIVSSISKVCLAIYLNYPLTKWGPILQVGHIFLTQMFLSACFWLSFALWQAHPGCWRFFGSSETVQKGPNAVCSVAVRHAIGWNPKKLGVDWTNPMRRGPHRIHGKRHIPFVPWILWVVLITLEVPSNWFVVLSWSWWSIFKGFLIKKTRCLILKLTPQV